MTVTDPVAKPAAPPAGRDAVGRRLRIAFAVHDFPVLSETFVINLALGLVERGHDLTILALNARRAARTHPDPDRAGGIDRLPVAAAPCTTPGRLRAVAAGLANGGGRARAMLAGRDGGSLRDRLRVLSQVRAFAALDAFDLVHCQFGTTGFDIRRHLAAGTLRTRRLVLHLRGSDITAFPRARGGAVYADLFRAADLVVANCAHFRDRAVALGCPRAKTTILYSGVDCGRFPFREPRPPSGRPVRLVTVARLVEKKGIEHAVHAVAALAARGIETEYRIVGDGPLRGRIESLVAATGMGERIRLVGPRPPAAVAAMLADSDIFVAPNVTAADGDQDAPINTLKEAMLTGLPVVATRHGGIPELVVHGEAGVLVPEGDADALATALAALIAAPGRWPDFARAGRRRVEETFDRVRLDDELLALYRALLRD